MATLKNRNDLLSQAATTLPDNTTQEISPQDVREMAENLAESNFNKITDASLVGLKAYSEGVVYENGQGVNFGGTIYLANKTTTPGPFNAADWDEYSAGGDSSTKNTGIKSGAVISINGGDNTKFDLAAGRAVIVDNSDLTNITESVVTWTAQTALTVGNLATEARTNVGISLNNDVLPNIIYTNSFTATVNGSSQTVYIAEKSVDNFSSEERRKIANLGRLVHSTGVSIFNAVNLQQNVNSPLLSVLDFINLFPAKNVEGNEFSGKVGTLSVAKTAGKGFRFGSNYDANTNDPNIQSIPAADPTTHFYRYQDGAGAFSQSASLTVLDPENYDDGSGTLQSVAPNRWTVQPVFVFAGSNTMFVQYGQAEYSSKDAAIVAIATANPTLDPNLVDDAIFRGYFIVKQGATDLANATQFEWRAPLGEIGAGQSSGIVVDLQKAFNASFNPEIVTDSTRGAVTFRRGSAADTDNVLEIQNGAGTNTATITGAGVISGIGSGITGINNLENNLTSLGTLGAGQDGYALTWDNTAGRIVAAAVGGSTIYTANDSLTGNRAITMGGFSLTFSQSANEFVRMNQGPFGFEIQTNSINGLVVKNSASDTKFRVTTGGGGEWKDGSIELNHGPVNPLNGVTITNGNGVEFYRQGNVQHRFRTGGGGEKVSFFESVFNGDFLIGSATALASESILLNASSLVNGNFVQGVYTTQPVGSNLINNTGQIWLNSGVPYLEYKDNVGAVSSISLEGASIDTFTESIIEASWSANTNYSYTVTASGVPIGSFCLVLPDEDVLSALDVAGGEWNGYGYVTTAGQIEVVCRVTTFVNIPASSIFTIKVL